MIKESIKKSRGYNNYKSVCTKASKYLKQMLTDLKEEIDSKYNNRGLQYNTFNDRLSRQKN